MALLRLPSTVDVDRWEK